MKKINKNLMEIDSDKDGISDFDEINIYKTDPNNPDTDGDGLSDCEEIDKGLNPLIRDYFIPNKCNNYRPKALRPKRLFFYGMSAIIIKIIVAITLVSVPLSAFFSPDYVSQEAKKIIALTNQIREDLNLLELNEDSKLDQAALWKAQDMAIKQYFSHTNSEGRKLSYWLSQAAYSYRFGGENLAMGFSNAQDAINAWVKSPTHYKNIIDPDFKDIGVGMSNGLYNGVETTFIAQYFGTKPIVQEKVEPVIQKNVETKAETKQIAQTPVNTQTKNQKQEIVLSYNNSALKKPTEQLENNTTVLAEKQNKFVLEIPAKLEFQDNKKLFNKDYVQVEVIAPQCTSLSIFVNLENQISKDICTSTEQLLLKEGVNKVQLQTNYPNDTSANIEYEITLDKTSPEIINAEKTTILAKENFAKEIIISAEVYLSDDTKDAKIYIKDNIINLVQDDVYKSKWTGHTIINNTNNLFSPAISPTIHATDFAGNELVTDIDWNSIPLQASIVSQYDFAKSQKQIGSINTLFGLSMVYYRVILFLAIILLLINIFVKIKIQRLDIIASSIVFIFVLFVLTII